MNNTDPQLNTLRRTPLNRAFTLIEILIVIALTAVLFALLIIPLVSALRYTKQAQIVTAAQDAARITRERITRELGSAVFVFDGTSHPFQTANAYQPGDDRYTNFLNLQMRDKNGAAVVGHAYNAKIDFVLPKLNDAGATIDPTTNLPIAYTQGQSGSARIGSPSYVFPLAAGTNAVRYFVGLRDPSKPYDNSLEGKASNNDDNTYILYRAEFQPYVKSGSTVGPNLHLFATRPNSSNVLIPDLDDPDFFRYVSTSDINWLDPNHANYPAQTPPTSITANAPDGSMPHDYPDGSPEQHNYRVNQWAQIAKVAIPGPNVDLLLLPHNSDNTLAYDAGTAIAPPASPCTPTSCPAAAHSGIAHDPVANRSYPIVNTSVTFRPATVSGSATPGTTADYNSSGVVASDQSGFTYIPTVYTATSQSWSLPFHVSLYPGNYDPAGAGNLSMYYNTEEYAAPRTLVNPPGGYTPPTGAASLYLNPGDILEYRHLSTDTNAPLGTLVYNITQGYPVTYDAMSGAYTAGGTHFVPMTTNPDTGTIMFSAPSLPNGPYDRYNRYWTYTPDPTGLVDLAKPATTPAALTDSPLSNEAKNATTSTTPLTGVDHAHLVPGSVRVYGPDQTSGPNSGQPISYTEIQAAGGSESDNQFSVNYAENTVNLKPGAPGPVSVVYDYQANLTLKDPAAMPSPPLPLVDLPSNPYLPMQVKVDYQTRDLIDVNIGVRIYDITTNRAQIIPTETKVKIGNSNR